MDTTIEMDVDNRKGHQKQDVPGKLEKTYTEKQNGSYKMAVETKEIHRTLTKKRKKSWKVLKVLTCISLCLVFLPYTNCAVAGSMGMALTKFLLT